MYATTAEAMAQISYAADMRGRTVAQVQESPPTAPQLRSLSTHAIDPTATMAPPTQSFSVDRLPDHVNTVQQDFQVKKRKGPQVELEKCPLFEMMQYSCNPPSGGMPERGQIICKPVVRLFRR